MKIIFLDIDGVLNSRRFDREEHDGNIDRSRLELLHELVEKSGATVVLSSSWRYHWDKDREHCDEIGVELERVFKEYGIELYDKTPRLSGHRPNEIMKWLEDNRGTWDSFVVIDDSWCDWGEFLRTRCVRTNPMIGRGLEREHIEKALEILETVIG